MEPKPAPAKNAKPDLENIFPGYKELAGLHQWATEVRDRIAGLTAELASLRVQGASIAQKTKIHQINNALHRSGYEQDKVLEKYRQSLADLVEDASIEWLRIKSAWGTNLEEQTFHLQVLQAKVAYLLRAEGLMEAEKTPVLGALAELGKELDHFANANLPASALVDDPLDHFGQTVERIGTVAAAVHTETSEAPAWRAALENPEPGALSQAGLEALHEQIRSEIAEISHHVRELRLGLPAGSWRSGKDLQPELYGFATLLHPDHLLHRLDLPEIFRYLDDDASSSLRRARLAALKQDEARCKRWLETYSKHLRTLDKAITLAREGNYRKAQETAAPLKPVFADLDYEAPAREAARWRNELTDIDQRLGHPMDQAEALLEKAFRRFWFGFAPARAARALLTKVPTALAEKARLLASVRGTDFHQDMEAELGRLRERLERLIRLHRKAERFLQLLSLASVAGFLGMTAVAGYLAFDALRVQNGSVAVEVKPLLAGEASPTIVLGMDSETGLKATFRHLREGPYRLTVVAPEYLAHHQVVRLHPAEHLVLPPIELKPEGGFLRLQSAEEGYRHEAHRVDRTDLAASGTLKAEDAVNLRLRPGRYLVRLSQRNRSYSVPLEVLVHEVTAFTPDFRFSRVWIDSHPQGAVVSLNGEDFGFTPLEVSLPPVAQSVAIKMQGFETYYLPVTPQGGAPLSMQVTLNRVQTKPKPPRPDNSSIPPVVPFPEEKIENP